MTYDDARKSFDGMNNATLIQEALTFARDLRDFGDAEREQSTALFNRQFAEKADAVRQKPNRNMGPLFHKHLAESQEQREPIREEFNVRLQSRVNALRDSLHFRLPHEVRNLAVPDTMVGANPIKKMADEIERLALALQTQGDK